VSSLLYGSECWTLTTKQRKGKEEAEMRFCRIHNQDIRGKLNLFSIMEQIKFYQMNWHHHVDRKEKHRIPKVFYKCLEKKKYRETNEKMERQFQEINVGDGKLTILIFEVHLPF